MVERCPCPGSCVVTSRAVCRKNGWRRFMNWIRGGVVVGLVATIAVRRKRRVVVVYMTSGAGNLRVISGQRKRRRIVIKLAVGP